MALKEAIMSPRILVADDSVTIQKVVELTFSKEDFQIVRALNGVEAIAKAKENRPDLILLDIFMPEKNGLEVCESLRRDPQFNEVPIILLVAAFEAFDQERGLRAGANDFVTKPFESKQLIAKVKQHLFTRTTKLAPEKIEAKMETPPVEPPKIEPPRMELAPAPRVEKPPLVIPLEVAAPIPPSAGQTVPTPRSAAQAAAELKAPEMPPPSLEKGILPAAEWHEAPEAETAPPIGEEKVKEEIVEERPEIGVSEIGVSEEELWQMLDLSSGEAPPLGPLPPGEEPAAAVVSEDSAEAFFELYSQGVMVESPPEAPGEISGEDFLSEAMAESPMEEPVIWEVKEGLEEEVISFDNLGIAVSEPMSEELEEIPVSLSQEEPALGEETGAAAALAEEEISGAKGVVESRVADALAMPPPLSEGQMEAIADRIVKEVADRLIPRLERIIWEVVPDLAEVLITKEIEKIKAAAEGEKTS